MLVEAARRADPDAFAALYRLHLDAVHAFAWRRTGRRDLAEDVVAASFERALRNIGGFRWRGDGSFRSWLLAIAANEAVDQLRREARPQTDRGRRAAVRLVAGTAVDPTEDIDVTDAGPRLRAALDRLNPRYERAVLLRHVAGLEPNEVADALGVSRSTSAVICHRAMRALRKAYEEVPR